MNTADVETSRPEQVPPKRILIVDDDERLLHVLCEWLTLAGHDVMPFSLFGAARAYLSAAKPDVLITDLRLGAFNGLQLVILAKFEQPEMNAIVLTGFDDPVLRRETSNAGAHFLTKPVTCRQLMSAIDLTPARIPQWGQSV